MLKITYLSHSSFLLDDGRNRLLIDPFLTGNPTAPVKADELEADFILLTHGHGDHLGDAKDIARRCGSRIIAVNELSIYLNELGLDAHTMHVGGRHKFAFGDIKLTIAHHSSSLDGGRYLGPAAGAVINIGGKKIYNTGDTGLFLDMKLIGELDKIDIMMLPIGDNFTMGINDAVVAVDFVNPAISIPMHYNTFPIISADPYEFKEKVEANGKKCRVMNYGETIEI